MGHESWRSYHRTKWTRADSLNWCFMSSPTFTRRPRDGVNSIFIAGRWPMANDFYAWNSILVFSATIQWIVNGELSTVWPHTHTHHTPGIRVYVTVCMCVFFFCHPSSPVTLTLHYYLNIKYSWGIFGEMTGASNYYQKSIHFIYLFSWQNPSRNCVVSWRVEKFGHVPIMHCHRTYTDSSHLHETIFIRII